MIKVLLFTFFTFVFFACANNEPVVDNKPSDENEINENWIEVVKDNTFQTGFSLGPLDPKIVQEGGGHEKTYLDTLDFREDGSNPVWRLAQWHSKYNLAYAKPLDGPEGSVYYVNEGNSRKIALYPDKSLSLEVNASQEYDNPRVNGQNWPHLLIAQEFNDKSPNVGKARHLIFSMELRLEKEENMMAVGTFNKSLHTAHSPLYFNIRNLNKNSPDYNHMMRFGIPSYDYRDLKLRKTEKISAETGHSNFIYSTPPYLIWGDVSFQDMKWHRCELDLKPVILRALKAIKEKDVFTNTSPDELVITGMNFGWEVPGTFDVALRIKNISLKAVK